MEKNYSKELIGSEVKIIASKNPSLVGISGKIVDETRSTIKIECGKKIKTLLKNSIMLQLKNGECLQGQTLIKRPEERLKK